MASIIDHVLGTPETAFGTLRSGVQFCLVDQKSPGPRSCPLLPSSSRRGGIAAEVGERLQSTRPIFRAVRASFDIRSVGAGVCNAPLELTPTLDRFSGRLVLQSTPDSQAVVERTYERPRVRRDETHDYGSIYVSVVDAGTS
jgi:hypothetical protein